MSKRSPITGIEAARRRLERRRQRTRQVLAVLRERADRSRRTAPAGLDQPIHGLVHDLAAVRARLAAHDAAAEPPRPSSRR